MRRVIRNSAFGFLLLSFMFMIALFLSGNSQMPVASADTGIGETASAGHVLSVSQVSAAEPAADTEPSAGRFADFLTDPFTVLILLSVAALGLLLAMFSPGFLPAVIGFSSLLLFFYGHLSAGLVGVWSIVLLLIGMGLLLIETFIPGGIIGMLGVIAIAGSILLAGENMLVTAVALLIALIIAISGTVILVKFFGKRLHLFKGMILTDSTDTESGYVSTVNRPELIGQTARTLTALRPTGTIGLQDERIDAVSEGRFIAAGEEVKIIKVEGSRIVVRELKKEEEE